MIGPTRKFGSMSTIWSSRFWNSAKTHQPILTIEKLTIQCSPSKNSPFNSHHPKTHHPITTIQFSPSKSSPSNSRPERHPPYQLLILSCPLAPDLNFFWLPFGLLIISFYYPSVSTQCSWISAGALRWSFERRFRSLEITISDYENLVQLTKNNFRYWATKETREVRCNPVSLEPVVR